ncbi:CHAT domain-containing protein [Neptunomonas phycophila]|uniref:CHAT domain-containing protein n=1 Tax=Neptunomonas phycophila TaxID=1572645 RepID=UPI0037360180
MNTKENTIQERFIVELASLALKNDDANYLDIFRDELMDIRSISCNDRESDELSRYIQIASSAIARIRCNDGRIRDGLLELEFHSNLRATEYFIQFWKRFSRVTDYSTCWLARTVSSLVRCLDTQSEYMRIDNTGSQKELFLKKVLPTIMNNKEELDQCDVIDLDYFVSSARNISNIPKLIDLLFSDLQILNQAVDKQSGDDLSNITSGIIEQTIKRHPDLLIVKLDIQQYMDDLLIITAHWNGKKAVYNSYSIPVSSDQVNTISQFDCEFDHNINLDLSFIDWKKIIPPGFNRVALLPSFYAASFPWIATGPEGSQLIDIVDDVIWIPGILNLTHHIGTKVRRECVCNFEGDNLRFGQSASRPLTKDLLLDKLSTVEEFSYLGHGEHRLGETPELKIGDYTFLPDELGEKMAGMKLAEIWACEAGMNRTDIPMGCSVNEPFGLDMKMLMHGVNSAIGTLWRVPELTTRIIKTKYTELRDSGHSPSMALLAAQRWWLRDGANELAEAHISNGLDTYLVLMGITNPSDASIDNLLGPIKKNDKERVHREKSELLARLKHPHTWAGFRFCGLYEHEIDYIDPVKFEATEARRSEFLAFLSTLKLKSGLIKTC